MTQLGTEQQTARGGGAAQDTRPAAAGDRDGPGSRFTAAIFDMDGVVADTAGLHAQAWQDLFDEVLPKLGEGVAAFDPVADCRRYVDGRSR